MGLLTQRTLVMVAAAGIVVAGALGALSWHGTSGAAAKVPPAVLPMPGPRMASQNADITAAPPATAPPMEQMATRLALRLQTSDSQDGADWTLLARAYMEIGRPGDAVHAFERARKLLGDADGQRLADHAAALTAARGGRIDDDVRALADAALRADPANAKARQLVAGVAAIKAPSVPSRP